MVGLRDVLSNANTLMNAVTATICLIALIVMFASLRYARNLDLIRRAAQRKGRVKNFYTLSVIRGLRKIAVLGIISLLVTFAALALQIIHEYDRPPFRPPEVQYLTVLAYVIVPIQLTLPALFMVVLVREARKFAGSKDTWLENKLDPMEDNNVSSYD